MRKILLLAIFSAQLAADGQSIFLPVSDGTVFSTGVVLTNIDLRTGDSEHCDLQFSSFNSSIYSSIDLGLSPYALPLFGNPVSVYGYDNASGQLAGSDYNAGTLLGELVLPSNLEFGQYAFFDVTSFVQSAKGSYFGFELRSDGSDVFCSVNEGSPELVATVPEPSFLALIGLAVVIWVDFAVFRQCSGQWIYLKTAKALPLRGQKGDANKSQLTIST
jgi:hypothetical protein